MEGKIVAETIKEQVKNEIRALTLEGLPSPHLAAILVGSNGASETYVTSKIRNCEETGIRSTLVRLEENCTEEYLLHQISVLNEDPDVDGILVQLPLPSHINENNIISAISIDKDVDGFHPENAGRLVLGLDTFIPATPYGILLMLEHYKIQTEGKHAVIIGRSNIVGRPLSILLSSNTYPGNCTVTLCHSRTRKLDELCQQADIIIAALGMPDFLTGNMVKKGAVVIDVGITRVADPFKKSGFAIKGDVYFEEVKDKASYITPVPGGVGLTTIAALLKNTQKAWKLRRNLITA